MSNTQSNAPAPTPIRVPTIDDFRWAHGELKRVTEKPLDGDGREVVGPTDSLYRPLKPCGNTLQFAGQSKVYTCKLQPNHAGDHKDGNNTWSFGRSNT